MQGVINQLFNGTIAEIEKISPKDRDERNKKLDKAAEQQERLFATFTKEQRKLFEKWQFCENDIWTDEVDFAYERGFKIGALLMVEILNTKFNSQSRFFTSFRMTELKPIRLVILRSKATKNLFTSILVHPSKSARPHQRTLH